MPENLAFHRNQSRIVIDLELANRTSFKLLMDRLSAESISVALRLLGQAELWSKD